VRTGLDAGAAEDDAGDVDKYVDDAGDFVVAEVDVKVVGCVIKGETLTEETEEEEDDGEVTAVVLVVVAIVDFVLVEENVEEWLLVSDTVDDAGLVLFSELDRICEAVATDVCVPVRVECVMGLEFGTLWHTSYTEMALASKTSKAQAEARQTKASSPSVRPDLLLLVHKQ